MRFSVSSAVAATALVACGSNQTEPPPPAVVEAEVAAVEMTPRDLTGLVLDARAIIASDGFKKHLSTWRDLKVKSGGSTVSGSTVVAQLSGEAEVRLWTVRYDRPHFFGRLAGCAGETADTVLLPREHLARTRIRSCVHRWASFRPSTPRSEPAIYSLAINTIVHEWTHAIADARGAEQYLDEGHAQDAGDFVSYTTGAVAQCAYLAALPEYDVESKFVECVHDVGTHDFRTGVVSPRWLEKFARSH